MGEAKRRGTYEQRRSAATAKRTAMIERQRAKRRQRWDEMTDEERVKRIAAQLFVARMMGASQ